MTINEAYQLARKDLQKIYDIREASNIADMIIENISGKKRIERITNRNILFSNEEAETFQKYLNELLKHKPVQYVLHEAWFGGIKFFVDENVLIPRPETEELVELIVSDFSPARYSSLSILDIGTGSGCIPITLFRKLRSCSSQFEIHATDISDKALIVAKKNSLNNHALISFFQADILNENEWKQFQKFDIIVSNPPYISENEKKEIRENVLCYEPHLALFVAHADVLIFYKKIAAFGISHLKPNGKLFFEINEMFGENICDLLKQSGYTSIQLKKDFQGKDRFIVCSL